MSNGNVNQVSLITTVFNESASIVAFLQSYLRQTKHAEEFIIVDGGSSDDTGRLILQYAEANPQLNIRLVVDESCSKKFSKGPIAKGRNRAISEATFGIIAVCDAGCSLDSRWLEEITAPFAESGVDVVAGWYEPVLDNPFRVSYARLFLPTLATVDRENFLPSSRSIAFRKEAWAMVEGYPEATYTAEDTMFDLLLKSRGCRFYFNEKAVVYWNCPADLDEAMEKHYFYGYGDGQYRLFKLTYAKLLFSLILPYKYLLKSRYKDAARVGYMINLSLVRGYLKGLWDGGSKG